ncbi:MAG: type IV secretion protein IcmV [Coxiella sp. (in: Bacteria)]|nr:MAG: type IV secretion protein IcmV [Coxiella sp. (in: g-proteobacteria)]
MGIKKVLKNGFFGGLNPKRILGVDSLKSQTQSLKAVYKSAFKGTKSDAYKPTSFDDCLTHYNVTQSGLEKRMRNAKWTVYFCLGLSAITVSSMFYQFLHHTLSGGVMCVVLTLILWMMSFREHFNLFQMRQRRLGCTVTEWFNSLFNK